MGNLFFFKTDKRNDIYMDDHEISWKSKGILSYLRKENTIKKFTLEKLINISKDNRISLRTGFKELIDKKYIYRFRIRASSPDYVYICFDASDVINHRGIKQIKRLLRKKDLKSGNLTRKYIIYILSSIKYNVLPLILRIKGETFYQKSVVKSDKKKFKELKELSAYWRKNIIKHDFGSETWKKGFAKLEYTYDRLNKKNNRKLIIKSRNVKNKKEKSAAFKIIFDAMVVYKKILISRDTVLTNKEPWRVSLSQFFQFREYVKNITVRKGKGSLKKLDGVNSWFEECREGVEYCIDKYGIKVKDKNPNLTAKIEEELELNIKTMKDRNILIKASGYYQEFFNEVKDKLNLKRSTDEKYAIRTVKYLRQYIQETYWRRNKELKVYYLSEELIKERFRDFLRENSYLL